MGKSSRKRETVAADIFPSRPGMITAIPVDVAMNVKEHVYYSSESSWLLKNAETVSGRPIN
jgi:hypothetical protein